ncbi:MAG TPA: citrate transporter [Telluria sp.]|nr:citrate transporter [Telluria sp.]
MHAAPALAGIPVEFILFAIVLGLVAFSNLSSLWVAVGGAVGITVYKLLFASFGHDVGLVGLAAHAQAEWVALANLLALLVGFALLARHFEDSRLPDWLPHILPDSWLGPLMLLVWVFVLSSFLDNIAAAMIGGAVAHTVFRGKVHLGYLAAIVAASNAGGSGSVVGDTTTTMMWLAGVAPAQVLHAYVAAVVALVVCAVPAALQQQKHSPITKDAPAGLKIDWARVLIVAFILGAAVLTNVGLNTRFRAEAAAFPFLGVAVVLAIGVSAPLRRPAWNLVPGALSGAAFLLSLVWCASLMPVEALPAASWPLAFGLGFVSAVFDNIPLTALALKQGGFDWGVLAYAVGFGGSMIWFGSSAGVALTGQYPEARSVLRWVRAGWHVVLAYVAGMAAVLAIVGWHPA